MKSRITWSVALLGLLVLQACGGPEFPVPAGSWGGEGVVLEVTPAGATLSDLAGCFGATTGDALMMDSSGEFDANGDYVNYPLGSRPGVAEPAHFSGSVHGDAMTFSITLRRGGRFEFLLRRGVAPAPPTRVC